MTRAIAQRTGLRISAPAAAVLGAAVAAWLSTGVGVGDVGLFAAHELGFVLVPGCFAYAALARKRPGPLKLVAVGYALGSVLEILAFAVTAAAHARVALWAYPPVTVAVAVLVLRRAPAARAADRSEPSFSARGDALDWALAALAIGAIGYILVAYFLFDPLPTVAGSVVYLPDLVFHLGVAAEALHHWPITDPKVAGLALHYENFIYMKLAATSQITHVPLPTVLFRLYILPLVVDLVALLACAGRAVGGRRAVGLAAAGLFVFVGALGLDKSDQLAFANTVFFSMYDSPSYMLGLVVFVAALIVLHGNLTTHPIGPSRWLLLALLLVGCAGTKATILPVLLGGLALYLVWERTVMRSRARAATIIGLDAPAATALLLAAVIFLATYWLIYAGGSGGLHFDPPGSVRLMDVIRYAQTRLAGSIGLPAFWVLASFVGVFGFCGATLAGIPAALSSQAVRRARGTALLLAILIASFVPFLATSQKGGSQNFFTYYGVCAASIVSAWGLALLWDRARPFSSRAAKLLSVSGIAWLGVLLVIALVPGAILNHPRPGPQYALRFGVPLLAVAGLLAWAHRHQARRRPLALAAAGALVLVGVLDTPLQATPLLVSALRAGSTPYERDSPLSEGLTPGLQQALAWIRTHTPTSAVLAVNNQSSSRGGVIPTYYYYSAFAQRRVFLEGWTDTIPAATLPYGADPFPGRLALNDAVFLNANRPALAVMERSFGVGYLLVDRVHGPVQPRLAALGRVVFANPAAIVYRVGDPAGAS